MNYDFPSSLEQYCHRVGRAGRQGEEGQAYSLLTRNMAPLCSDLIKLLRSCGQEIEPNLIQLCKEYESGAFVNNDESNQNENNEQSCDDSET